MTASTPGTPSRGRRQSRGRAPPVLFIDYCRVRVRRTLDALTEDAASRPLPGSHRYHGTLYGVTVGGVPLHVLEHATQIRQFLTAAGVKVRPMFGDRGFGEPSDPAEIR